jgi:hypothetical protein
VADPVIEARGFMQKSPLRDAEEEVSIIINAIQEGGAEVLTAGAFSYLRSGFAGLLAERLTRRHWLPDRILGEQLAAVVLRQPQLEV